MSVRRGLRATLLLAALGATGAPAAAQWPGTVPVIEPGREEEVLGLFAPHRLGEEVAGGFRLGDVRIEAGTIEAVLVRGDERASVVLRSPELDGAAVARSASFALRIEADGAAGRRAAEALVGSVQRNDPGGFFRVRAVEQPGLGLELRGARTWLFDGTLWLVVGLGLMVALAARALRGAPRAEAAFLLATVAAGALYRVWLAPHTLLGAWPYSRTVPLMRHVWEGPGLGLLSEHVTGPLSFLEVATTTTLLFAIATPIAVFAHAVALTGDRRVALAAAAVVAILPVHVRFSHSEVELVASLVLSSLGFAAIHVATKDPSAGWRGVATLALPILVVLTLVTRPLNVLFVPLFVVAAVIFREPRLTPWPRLVAVIVLVLAAGTAAILGHFLSSYGDQVREGADPAVLAQALEAFFSLRWNTLIHPGITPPVLTLLAVLGGWWAWARDRRLVLFLIGWLLAFFVTHAYVLPEQSAMQARYHLHLVAPFALLSGLGLVELLRRRPTVAAAAAALIAASPLVHLDFVQDLAFNDLREHAFLARAKGSVPEGCTVLEHAGADHEVRFARLGAVRLGATERRRWVVQPLAAVETGSTDPLRPEARARLGGDAECLVYYEGLPCWSDRGAGDGPLAEACVAMREAVPLEVLARTRFESRIYDGNLRPAPSVDALTLTLYRVRPPRPR